MTQAKREGCICTLSFFVTGDKSRAPKTASVVTWSQIPYREAKLPLLSEADEALLDGGRLTGEVRGVTKALDLVGPRFLKDTLTAVEKGCIVCNTGILGGVFTLNGFDPIKDIPNGVYLTGFFSNYPTQNVMDALFSFLKGQHITPRYGKRYVFHEVSLACEALDSGNVNGKIVITV